MLLFTFFMDYKGGTYISQLKAESYMSALKLWATSLDLNLVTALDMSDKEELVKEVGKDSPVELKGIRNTWCCTFLIRNSLLLLHFTNTVEN